MAHSRESIWRGNDAAMRQATLHNSLVQMITFAASCISYRAARKSNNLNITMYKISGLEQTKDIDGAATEVKQKSSLNGLQRPLPLRLAGGNCTPTYSLKYRLKREAKRFFSLLKRGTRPPTKKANAVLDNGWVQLFV
jgi:hypothetical protein